MSTKKQTVAKPLRMWAIVDNGRMLAQSVRRTRNEAAHDFYWFCWNTKFQITPEEAIAKAVRVLVTVEATK